MAQLRTFAVWHVDEKLEYTQALDNFITNRDFKAAFDNLMKIGDTLWNLNF
jgi:hypothetical protein